MKRSSNHKFRFVQAWLPTFPLLLVGLLPGCATRQANKPLQSEVGLPQPGKVPPEPKWVVPAGWVKAEPSVSFEVARYTIPGADGDGLVKVNKLKDYNYGLLANVNRWREQVGLGFIDSGSLKSISTPTTTASGDSGTAIHIVGAEKSIVAAVFIRGDTTWFIRLIAPNELAELQLDSFDKFTRSFHL